MLTPEFDPSLEVELGDRGLPEPLGDAHSAGVRKPLKLSVERF